MEMNEIMVNEEVVEVMDEITTKNSGNGLWIAGIAAVTLGAGYLICKKVINPIIAKRKAMKEEKVAESGLCESENCEVVSDENAEM